MDSQKDSGTTTVERQSLGSAPKGVLILVCFALFFAVLEASAVAVVLPDIADDFSVDTGQLSWLMTGFLLIYGIAIPFYGRLADRHWASRVEVANLLEDLGAVLICYIMAHRPPSPGGATLSLEPHRNNRSMEKRP